MTLPDIHPDESALLRTICESPLDDLPRLVYADWLDEHGREDRAEFIRGQIKLTARPRVMCGYGGVMCFCDWCALAGRVSDLWAYDGVGDEEAARVRDLLRTRIVPTVLAGGLDFEPRSGPLTNEVGCGCSRGFVSRVRLSLRRFTRAARRLAGGLPLDRVVAVDRRAAGCFYLGPAGERRDVWWWNRHDCGGCRAVACNHVPPAVFDLLRPDSTRPGVSHLAEFTSETAANAGLSAALVGFARGLAGMSPLPAGAA